MEGIKFLRIQGRIREGRYEPLPGFETNRIPGCFKQKGNPNVCGYTLVLLDEQGQLVTQTEPEINLRSCGANKTIRLAGYLPLIPGGSYEIRFHGVTLFRRRISQHPPTISLQNWKREQNNCWLSWKAEAESDDLRFSVACITDGKTIPLALNTTKTEIEIDLNSLPICSRAQISIRVSDGTRSSVVQTETYEVEARPPIIAILQPATENYFRATQPVSVSGYAASICGYSLSTENLTWWLDETQISSGKLQLVLSGLQEGKHLLELRYQEGNTITSSHVYFFVQPLEAWEKEWKMHFETGEGETPDGSLHYAIRADVSAG